MKNVIRKILIFSLILFIASFNFSSFFGNIEENCVYESQSLCFFPLKSNIEIKYNDSYIPDLIVPECDIARIPVYIYFWISGLFSKLIIPFFRSHTARINLEVGDHPDYIAATLSKGLVQPFWDTKKPYLPESTTLTVSFNQNAPAFQTMPVKINAKLQGQNLISKAESSIQIPFTPGYYSDFTYDYLPIAECEPGETLIFPINITGYANAPSKMTFEILDQSEGWNSSISPEIIIGSKSCGQIYNATVNFTVYSPNLSGIVDMIGQFSIQVTTMADGHPEVGIYNTATLYFAVRCRNYW